MPENDLYVSDAFFSPSGNLLDFEVGDGGKMLPFIMLKPFPLTLLEKISGDPDTNGENNEEDD